MAGDGKEGIKKALIISISDYSKLRPLDFCKNDGQEMYDLLKSLGYEIADSNRLIGEVKWDTMRDAIMRFFGDRSIKSKDTLLFYFSGHGLPDGYGDNYLATSEIDPDEPNFRGFSFDEISKMMHKSVSTRIVTMLDCCYSGAATLGGTNKGSEGAAAKLGREAIDNKSKILEQGQGKCLLAASMPTQEAYGLKEKGHSIFTYYLLEGLRGGNGESVDNDGRVTPDSLGSYVYEKVTDIAPDQKPIKKVEESGNIILAYHPRLKPIKSEELLASLMELLVDGKIDEFNGMREQNANLSLDFSRANLYRLHLSNANLSNANLLWANLIETDLEGADLTNADLFRADLEGTNLNKSKLTKASLEEANLSNANLTKANLSNANLTKANLSNANLYGADLQQANFFGADLRGANLTNSNKLGADFNGAILLDFKVKQPEDVKEVKQPEDVKEVKQPEDVKEVKQPTTTSQVASQPTIKKTNDETIIQPTTHPQVNQKIPMTGPPKIFPPVEESRRRREKPPLGGSKRIVLILAVVIGVVIAGIISVYFSTDLISFHHTSLVHLPQPTTETKQEQYSFLTAWGSSGSGQGQFNFLHGVAVDSSGNVYVADPRNRRIQEFTSDGKFITTWGSPGDGKGQFYDPYGVAVDSSGNVYVADTLNNRTQKFTSDGKFITKWGSGGSGQGQFANPHGVAVDPSGNVYVADTENNRTQKFTSNGKFITKWGSGGSGQGQFANPHGVAVDPSGNVYVADTENNRIQKFTSDGKFITMWGSKARDNGDFYGINGVAVDSSGNVYLTESSRIQKFTSDGKFITMWEVPRYAECVAVDSSGDVYLTDSLADRVNVFRQVS